MRCIEIVFRSSMILLPIGLTLTWDVLKCGVITYGILLENRLTLTWDVLKCEPVSGIAAYIVININMRCIEIAG